MKKILFLLSAFFIGVVITSSSSFTASADSFGTSGNYTYMESRGEITIRSVEKNNMYGTVRIPSTIAGYPVRYIGDSAFSSCQYLTEIIIPDSVRSIGQSAFANCDSLTYVDIPRTVTSIAAYAFDGCDNLTDVTISASVSTLESTFSYCKNLTNVSFNTTTITSIGGRTFSATGLKSITLPDTVTSIGDSAFAYCSNLEKVTLSSSLKSIGSSAFDSCYALKSITLPDSLETIGDKAFYNCTALEGITIPKAVSEIGIGPFMNCSKLSKINLDAKNERFSVDSYGVLFDKYKTVIIQFPANSSRTSYTIPGTVVNIRDYAFFGCSKITAVDIPASVTEIGKYAFTRCGELKSIVIPDSVTSIGASAFNYCTKMESIVIHDSLTSIGNSAFWVCDSLSTVYYCGTQTKWQSISIGTSNSELLAAQIYYNYCPANGASGHKYKTVVTAATCYEKGYSTHTCSCGEKYTDAYTNALTHSYKDGCCIYCKVPEGYTGIFTKKDLLKIQNSSGKFILMNDIVFSETDFIPTGEFYNNGSYWTGKSFYGVLDGNGYSIVNLRVRLVSTAYSISNVGLIAYNSGTVKNLSVVNADIYAESGYQMNVGIICGKTGGLIENCHTSGTIYVKFNSDACGDSYIGGIAGFSVGAKITGCSNSALIDGYNTYTFPYMVCGGILGGMDSLNRYTHIIEQCYNTGTIKPYTLSDSYFAGIAGRASTGGYNKDFVQVYIRDCYNAGTLSGTGGKDYKIGGIVGEYHEYTNISNCYNVGKINGKTENYGGITAYMWSGVSNIDLSSAYYLDSSCDVAYYTYYSSDAISEAVGNKLSSAQMKAEKLFKGFDFENVWVVDALADYPYPQLINNLQGTDIPERHNYRETVITEPTCTDEGSCELFCTDCKYRFNIALPSTGHSYTSQVISPTCTEKGYTKHTCACGDTYSTDEVDSIDHSYSEEVIAPTCTENGYTQYTCECADSYTDNTTDATGHTFGETTPANAADCENTGNYAYKPCTVCNKFFAADAEKYSTDSKESADAFTIPALEHDYADDFTVDKKATCTEAGSKSKHCSRCESTTEVTEISAREHTLTDTTVATPATCEADGVMNQKCSNEATDEYEACEYTTTRVIPAEGHKKGTEATCTEPQICTVCETELVAANGHKGGTATCMAKAVCTECNQFYGELDADNHTGKNTVKNKVAETCGTKGYTGDTVCECGVTVAEGKEIPATGKHTGGKATCKVKAVCTACKQSYGSLRSHSYSTVVTTKATLKKNGKTAVKCTVCGNVKSTATVYKVKSVKLSTTVYAYSGKNKTPSVTVKDSKGNVLKKGTDYTVSYPKKRKSVGKYTVTVTFKGKYSGTKKLTFEIVPAQVTLSKVTAGSKQLTASWSKVKGASGYEVQYSTSKKFTKKTTKAVIRSSKSKKTTIKSLKKGKTYYVRVRAYKTVGKVKVYGAWSTVKSVKVK